jgi:hypothetical protein
VQDKLLVADDTKSEYTKGCHNSFNSQDPYDRAIKLLATVCDSKLEHNNSINNKLKEDTNIISMLQNNSSYITPTLAATAFQKLVTAIDS